MSGMMNTTTKILDANSNTVLKLFKNRCILNPAHVAEVIHHIIPRSVFKGDPHRIENLAPLCNSCHTKVHIEGTKKYREVLQSKHGHIT
jgi:5-methylcytosine-specific restriction endonuclease McrA